MKPKARSSVALAARRGAREATVQALREGRKVRSATFTPLNYYRRKPKHTKGHDHE